MLRSYVISIRLSLLAIFLPIVSTGQQNDSGNSYRKDFYSFKNSIIQQFDSFVQHNDSVFGQFLLVSWKEFKGIENKIPIRPKPIEQPKITTPLESATPQRSDTVKILPILPHEPIIDKKEAVPPKLESQVIKTTLVLQFYGTEIPILLNDNEVPLLNAVNEEGIFDFFNKATRSTVINRLAINIKKGAEQCKLNDWGLASMFMATAQKLYSSYNCQILFTWYGLIRNGFNPKIGYVNGAIFLLLPSNEKIYSMSYELNGIKYYLVDFNLNESKPASLSIYEGDYPFNKKGFSMLLTQTPVLGNNYRKKIVNIEKTFELNINQSLIDFYSFYPSCELKVFFAAPLSENILQQLDSYFSPLIANKTDAERVEYLLDFVQQEIKYETDVEQFGREKYFFGEETLFYDAADCEDRAVLLAKLINRYTKLEVIGLLYPEHVSVAVNLSDIPGMKYFTYKEKHFYNCDPTYLGARCGEIMTRLMKSMPEIIDFEF